MSDLLVRGGLVLPSAAAPEPVRANVLIRGGLVEAVGRGLSPGGADTLDAEGLLVIPGLINGHLHSPGNLMRGALDGMPLEVFMLYEVPPATGPEDPALVRLRTLLGAVEMLKLGITAVADDAFFVPLTTTEAIDAIAQGYADSGMRATIGLDQPIVVEYEKFPFLADLLPAALRDAMDRAPRETPEGMLAHYRHLIDRWHGAAGGRIGAAVSCSAIQRATPDYLRALDALSAEHDLPFFCHILETKLQRVLGEEKHGRSLVKVARDLGVLGPRMEVIHAIWIDAEDAAILGASGATVAHNPVCNMRLGSGIMPFRMLRDAGVPICLGTDEAVSDDSHNLWGAMKAAGVMHALSDPDHDRWPTAPEILSAVWDGGDRMLRRPERLGRIEPGAAGDLALLDLSAPPWRPLHDIRRQLVLCESGASVRHVVVAGEVVVRDGTTTRLDERALTAEVRAREPELRRAAAALREQVAPLEPFYRRIVRMAAERDVGFTRWVGR